MRILLRWSMLDLSLFRCDTLAEFLPVGEALTPGRKSEEESRSIHRTASILGFLFNDIIPDTPELRKAFGTRMSNILSHPDINLESDDHGTFRDFVGADATSGDSSISVLLLTCLFANGSTPSTP